MTARVDQETTISVGRLDDVVRIYTSDFRHLQKLRQLVSNGSPVREVAGGSDWGQFECDISFFHVFSAFRRKRVLSEETRAKRAAVLAAHRAEAVA